MNREPESLSVVLPLYATRSFVPELIERLLTALATERPLELVFVDDGCPERSYEAVLSACLDPASALLCRHGHNYGQHAAVLTGLANAGGDFIAVMDTDLQDAPEDLPLLVRRLSDAPMGTDAVAAGRAGRYEDRSRRATGRLFRRSVHWLTRGRIPPDAAMFVVMTRAARDRVLALGDSNVHLIAALGRTGAVVESLPLGRRPRTSGSSGYRFRTRLRVAARALVVLTPAYPLLRGWRSRSHPELVVSRIRPVSGAVSALGTEDP